MNPRAIDVQLLLVFDALMSERHVTRAAQSIGLSQPAVSHALARLRDRFGDPLLVRTARGMEPTERALELIGPARDAIRQVQDVFLSRPDFDPARSQESFVIRMGDANEFLLLPSILAELEARAPSVSLIVRHLSPTDTIKALEDGSIDFAVSAFLSHPKSIRSSSLMKDRMVCATRHDHPSTRRRLTVDTFLNLRHIRVVQHAGDVRFVDEHLQARGLRRNVAATIPHWLVALHSVTKSGLAMAIPERMARHFDRDGSLALRRIPVGGAVFDWQIYWHRRNDAVTSQVWMRKLVSEICARLEAP
ncbi:MAG: LysR family transcriptional regulator [Burkholderiales bacterium]|nr:LysR family transcriptional regulator [Burkholderiales bacterium]